MKTAIIILGHGSRSGGADATLRIFRNWLTKQEYPDIKVSVTDFAGSHPLMVKIVQDIVHNKITTRIAKGMTERSLSLIPSVRKRGDIITG